MIDLISDTVTRPVPGMLEAMSRAVVGDDVFGEDPAVNELEARLADLFGKEAGLFCPSGTMSNQIAIKCHTRPLDEMICEISSHVYQYEVAGYAFHSGIGVRLIQGHDGIMTAEQLREAILPRQDWLPVSRLLVLENSVNRAGGTYYTLEEMYAISRAAAEYGLARHLDGARIFNVLVETGDRPDEVGRLFDTVSICLSKGLGAPAGSVLLGPRSMLAEARRIRKVMGGGMRQAGYLAAACTYALDNHVDRLATDNRHAALLGAALQELPFVADIRPVRTNIVVFDLKPPITAAEMLSYLKRHGIRASTFGPATIRFVTHLDISSDMIHRAIRSLQEIAKEIACPPD